MKLPIEAIMAATHADTAANHVIEIDSTKPLSLLYGKYEDIQYLEDDLKAKLKYIRYIEKEARGSFELRNYLSMLRENAEMTQCRIMSGVTGEDARIELHHFPFTMFDISRIILDDALKSHADVSSFNLIGRIVQEHYLGNVGLVPLSLTAHELVHDGKLVLSLKSVTGNWQRFAYKYRHVLTDKDIETLQFLISSSSNAEMELHNFRKLRIVKRFIELPKTEENEETEGMGGVSTEENTMGSEA